MARCDFAVFMPISGPVGSNLGGPFKIVHHTTEGSTAAGAFAAFRANRSDPHFTVDATRIVQHIDTAMAARALRNLKGGVQTNRLSAIQIEIVGAAAKPKGQRTLENVAKLCRWLEATHNIPPVWPSGPPKAAINGRDPGGHNRSAANWATRGGHYGHSQVPENSHWDPGYTAAEAQFVLIARPGEQSDVVDPELDALYAQIASDEPEITADDITMPDHAVTELDEDYDAAPVPALGDAAWRIAAIAGIAGVMLVAGYVLGRGASTRPLDRAY